MIKYKLECSDCKIDFDSWFASSAEFEKLKKKKLLVCHICNSIKVDKTLMAPRVMNIKDDLKNSTQLKQYDNIKKTIKNYQKFIKDNFNYVGDRFTYEARSIHYNKKKNEKGIYGSASDRDIKELKEELLSIDKISSVVSIIDVPLVKSSETPLEEMINNVPTILSNDVDIDKAEKEILNSPIYKNLIISSDGTTTAIQINLNNSERTKELNNQKRILTKKKINNSISPEESIALQEVLEKYTKAKESHDKEIHALLKSVRLIQNQFSRENNVELRMGGIPMIADDMITYVRNDLINFGLGVFIFIVITLIIIFREIKWVVLPILSCTYAVLFMIGLLGLLNWQVTVISSNFISLMLILTLSMNIHLIVRYKQLSSSSSNQYDAVSMTTRQMVWPCLYTALTTIVAFASLIFSDIKPVIDFGYMMTFGLIVTFLTSFTLLPCILLLLRKEKKLPT